jgi:HSP20 family molecular chaperone IbpA
MSTLRDALASLPGATFADLLESDDAYLVVIDLPGATSETTDVRVDDGRVRIEAQREKSVPEGFRYVREKRDLFVDVEFPLPPDAESEGAEASIDAGVLELRLPKRPESGGVSIAVEDA